MNIFEEALKTTIVEMWGKLRLAELKPTGGGYVSAECPSSGCGMKKKQGHKVSLDTNKGLFYCFSCGASGDVVNLVAIHHECSNSEAAEWITGKTWKDFPNPNERTAKPVQAVEKAKADPRKTKALTRLCAEAGKTICPVAVDYLAGRGIPRKTLKAAWKSKVIGTSLLSDDLLKEIAKEIATNPEDDISVANTFKWLRARPILFPYRSGNGVVTSCEFRRLDNGWGDKSIRAGRAEKPWMLMGTSEAAIVEGAIDGFSLRELGYKQTVYAIPGTQNWDRDWLKNHKEFLAALDNDKAGHKGSLDIILRYLYSKEKTRELLRNFDAKDTWAETVDCFMELHSGAVEKSWLLSKRLLPISNDWNDDLNHQLKLQQQ